jgi:hypothetical protein
MTMEVSFAIHKTLLILLLHYFDTYRIFLDRRRWKLAYLQITGVVENLRKRTRQSGGWLLWHG